MAIRKPIVQHVDDTVIGKILKTDPVARRRHKKIVAESRESARPEIEALERSTKGNHRDPHAYFR